MKKLPVLFIIYSFLFFTTSCGEEEIIKTVNEEVVIDETSTEKEVADTSSTDAYQEEVTEVEVSLKEAMKAHTAPKVEEGAMSFCDCVKKNKALTDKMMSDEASDEEFDSAMKELEAMKTGDCKIMFPPQNNIEEKQAHALKVKKCLK